MKSGVLLALILTSPPPADLKSRFTWTDASETTLQGTTIGCLSVALRDFEERIAKDPLLTKQGKSVADYDAVIALKTNRCIVTFTPPGPGRGGGFGYWIEGSRIVRSGYDK